MNARASLVAAVALVLVAPCTAQAQFTVFDPTNLAQAVARFRQLQQMYALASQQAQRLQANMRRYRVPEITWTPHDVRVAAATYLEALNAGDVGGQRYRRTVEPVDDLDAVIARVPAPLRHRLTAAYHAIQIADSVAMGGTHGIGMTRARATDVLDAIRALEDDTLSDRNDFHTQAALLDKLTGAAVLGLRVDERTSQLAAHTLEQLLVENKRKRESETALMNARLHHWRFAAEYGDGLTRHTAARLDAWRQP